MGTQALWEDDGADEEEGGEEEMTAEAEVPVIGGRSSFLAVEGSADSDEDDEEEEKEEALLPCLSPAATPLEELVS